MTAASAPPRPPVHYRRPPAPTPDPSRRRRPRLPGNRDLAIALVLVLVAVAVAAFAFTRGPRDAVMDHSQVELPSTPPAEWAKTASWSSPPLHRQAGRVLVVGGDKVGLVLADRHVVLVEAATGRTVWNGRVPDAEIKGSLHSTTVDGTPSIALHVGDRLLWWVISTGEEHGVDVPAGARVTFLGDGPLVVAQATVAVVAKGRLSTMPLPDGATALAARADGTVTAASTAGWWHLSADRAAGAAVPWETWTAQRISPQVFGYASGNILVALPGTQPRLIVYVDRDKDVRYAYSGPILLSSPGPAPTVTWRAAPNGAWGIADRTLVDLEEGSFEDLGAWQTVHVASDRALGKIGTQRVVVGPNIPRGVLTGDEGFPEDLTTSGALVRTSEKASGLADGTIDRIYLLPPR